MNRTETPTPPCQLFVLKAKRNGHVYLYQFSPAVVGDVVRQILVEAIDVEHPMPWTVARELLQCIRSGLKIDVYPFGLDLMRDITCDAGQSPHPGAWQAASYANRKIRETLEALK